jgi:hypothetical protein
MRVINGILHVKTIPHPKPNTDPIGFVVGYNDEKGDPIEIAFDLPYAGVSRYHVNLSWREWQQINVFLQGKIAEGLSST